MATHQAKSEPPPTQMAAHNIGRYRIIGRLGKGGMAEVLLTLEHDEVRDFKRLVVVKRVIPALEEEDPQFIQMFLDEARLGARLNHANIVQTYDVGEESGSPYLAMEFLDGQSLHVLQRRLHSLESKLPLPVALRIFCDVLEGLHYAHELRDFDGKPLGVIHRDVTPSNIFIKYDGTTKLVDFGIAKSATQREKTRAGIFKGKMAYMSPEQLRDEPITRSVDVWAMGIVMWETLAGERLFRGKNDFETVQAVMKREVPKLSLKRNDIPPSVDAIIRAAIERDPNKRIKTAEELKSRLEEVAFEIGKPLRRSDVANLMQELFTEAIQQNQRIVREFLEKSQPTETEYLRVKSTGAIEVRPSIDDSSSRTDVMPPSVPIPSDGDSMSGTLPDVEAFNSSQRPGGRPSTAPGGGSVSQVTDRTRIDPRPAGSVGKDARPTVPVPVASAEVDADEDDEDAPRPVWHWILLVVALLGVGAAVWYLLAPT